MRLAIKILTILGLSLVVLVPVTMIRGTVQDRQRYRTEAVEEVARSTAGPQTLAGPVLLVPYRDTTVFLLKDANGKPRREVAEQSGTLVFFADDLALKGEMRSLPRMRGLHEVRVFELDSTLSASFRLTVPRPKDAGTTRVLGEPVLGIGISDVRGFVGAPALHVSGRPVALQQGAGRGNAAGVHATLRAPQLDEPMAFDVQFRSVLQGTEDLAVAPLAARNRIAIASPWPHPLFHGDFLPRLREISAAGFRAQWDISSLASNAQAQARGWLQGGETPATLQAIGVSLVDPVNVYSQVDRATKYGMLFVLLTFVAFFVFEHLKQWRIHPIQYALVGLAIAIFFLLLLALSERIAFLQAYLVAAAACLGLIGYYLRHVLGGWVRGAGFAGMLATLYGALYGLLVSEDNALVLGSGLLFVILAAVMVATRKVDWYRSTAPAEADAA